MKIAIRPEQPGDERAIRALTDAAFRDMVHADGDEGPLVERLRADGDLTLSLVALSADEAIVGHIAFSPVSIEHGEAPWYQLAPVSVIPLRQKTGIGSDLIEKGLSDMRGAGAKGIALVGDPDYYSRFGFTREHDLSLSDELDPFLQILVFEGEKPSGKLTLAPAFDG
ncbi:GNAT family N-acetyltransferase [Erythrobacter litoralis]|uniref:Acetyltransferase n=1 Tax=Erythrobacter litoralis (strain HTCC2594) TaxID=314225 RepID=Q2N753_ERYLH|nr:N-acetyltransferase [Erythrobacter litoralis]ABC64488.1 acetyltransferase [Erythrobacter litoralis HTCC2594]